MATGHLLRNIEGGLLAISADGRRMLAGSSGKTLRLSDPVTGEGRQAFPAEAPWNVHALAFPPQGARVIAVDDKLLELWDADAGKRQLVLFGMSGLGGPPAHVTELMAREMTKWGAVIREAKIKLD